MSDESNKDPGDEGATDAVESPAANAPEPDRESDSTVAASEVAGAKRRAGLSRALTLLVAVVAVAGMSSAVYFWWQAQRPQDELTDNDLFVLESLDVVQVTLGRLRDEVALLQSELGESRAEADTMRQDLEVLPAELRALRRQVETIQGGRLDARDAWLREQAAYYLLLANTELAIGGRVGSAVTALELADDVLRDLGDPALTGVRAEVARELQSLRAVELPDFDGYLADLAGLIARAPELPTRAAAPENYDAPDESLEDVEPGLGRLWARTKGAVTSIVRIEAQEEPPGPVLTEAERRIARRQLALELQIARTALLERDEATFRASLVAADGILNRDFDRAAQSIVEARTLLGEMMRAELAPRLPDIGNSLTQLRAAAGAD
jgi:uroporphyrin-3 C-methyltransferase